MKLKMELLSDTVFGNGMSVPGGEDTSVLNDEFGFPYFKGGTFKGIFREELERLLEWKGMEKNGIDDEMSALLGVSGASDLENQRKIVFSDFTLSKGVKKAVLEEIGLDKREIVLNTLSHTRAFTSISEDGNTKDGSLRTCRCINAGLCFYSTILCKSEDEACVKEVISLIKWVGTMTNRGFGKVKITVIE